MDNRVQTDANPFSQTANEADYFRYDARFTVYGSFSKRLKSFDDSQWNPVERRILSEAGFFDPGRRDTIQCFYCGLRMEFEWEDSNSPWRDHARHVGSGGCGYLSHMKDQAFVRSRGETGEGGGATCFDRDGGESGWIPCRVMNNCRLCVWEFWMTPEEEESDEEENSD